MILKSAVVRKFRSVEDSGLVRFEPDVTCLVGQNESGKTAFLEALYRSNPHGRRSGFEELRDYPRRLRARERAEIPDTVPVVATFELQDDDIEAAWRQFGPGVLTSRELRVERTYGNRRRLTVHQDKVAQARHLIVEAGLDSGLADGADFPELLTRLERELQRGQRYYERNEYESALAVWRSLDANSAALGPHEQTQYAYLRGMTDYRLGFRAEARHWLARAQAGEHLHPGGLPSAWNERLWIAERDQGFRHCDDLGLAACGRW